MQQQLLLRQVVDHLKPVHGLSAIVLGGSHASGTNRPDSDIDIGLYYNEDRPLDIDQIRAIVRLLNDAPNPAVTDLGEWGTWVNGGAWLTVGGQRVDFLIEILTLSLLPLMTERWPCALRLLAATSLWLSQFHILRRD